VSTRRRHLVTALVLASGLACVSPPAVAAQVGHQPVRTVTTTRAGGTTDSLRTFTPRASSGAVSVDGGDLVTLARPVTVRAASALGSSWRSVAFGSPVPADGAGAVVLSVTAARATRPGQVQVRPTGSTGSTAALDYPATRSVTGLTVAKLGSDGTVQVASTAGSPVTSVRLVAWVPELSGLAVPQMPGAPVAVTLSSTARNVAVGGAGTVPADLSAALVSIRTSSSAPGRLTWWRPGDATPTTGHSFPKGVHRTLLLVAPSSQGLIRLKALTGKASASVQLLGWAGGATTLAAVKPAALASARASTLTPVGLTGRAGIPSAPQDVAVSVDAPAGATVKVWPNATGSGIPVATSVSDGGALSLLLQVPTGKKVSVKVSGTRAASPVVAIGYVSTLGAQSMSFVEKPGTHLLGAGDIAATGSDGVVTLASSAEPVAVGDHVLARAGDAAPYLGVVTDLQTSGGQQHLTLGGAQLSDAFTDFTAAYDGAVDQPVTAPTGVAARS
jgi:hypothetical protein